MTRRVEAAQHVSRMCFVCGRENAAGLEARFFAVEGGELVAEFTPREEHQGYPGRLHGGIASTILDEAMGRTLNLTDDAAWGVTLELSVRFRKPVPIDAPVRAVCRLTEETGRIFRGSGEILLPDGSAAVTATGTYMRLPIDRITDADFASEWFPDDRELPDTL